MFKEEVSKVKNLICHLFMIFMCISSQAAVSDLEGDNWQLYLTESGTIQKLIVTDCGESFPVDFFQEQNAGPNFYVSTRRTDELRDVILHDSVSRWKLVDKNTYEATLDDLQCAMKYLNLDGKLALNVSIRNIGHTILQPIKAGIKLGIDTYMEEYPDWLDIYFPTLLRCEKTHFWGYLMSPSQKIMVIASPDPVASWSLDYNYSSKIDEKTGKAVFWGKHRIEGINIDFLNALPLPERHPQNLYQLAPGQVKEWTVFLIPVRKLTDVGDAVSGETMAPFFDIERTSLAVNEEGVVSILSDERPEVSINGNSSVELRQIDDRKYSFTFSRQKPGAYMIRASARDKISEAVITVRHPWVWYLDRARSESERCHQKASTHIESWYGFTSAFLAAKYIPDPAIDKRREERFDFLYSRLFENHIPVVFARRVQNSSGAMGP